MTANAEFADDQIATWLRSLPATSPELDITATRRAGALAASSAAPRPEIAHVAELEVAGRRARLYRPSPDRAPLILYLHGGGWTIGSIETHDRVTRRLAARSGAAVLSLEYRLAPEHPWPAAIDDTVAALEWLSDAHHVVGPISTVAVAGDSAGGTLATLACLRLRDTHPEALPVLQVLLCPNTDLTGSQPSMREKATGYGLTSEGVRFFTRQWVPDERMWSDPRVSPLHAPQLAGLPRALVITAEHDPLRDEGERYAERLWAAGVEVTLRREPGLIHGFICMDRVSAASARAADRVADEIRELLAAD